MSRRRVVVDTLAEVRRAMRILRRVEKSLVQAERHRKRAGENAQERARRIAREEKRPLDDGLPL